VFVSPDFLTADNLMNVLAATSGQERYSRIPDEVVRFVLGHFGTPEGEIAPEVLDKISRLPRARELAEPPVEKSLEQLHEEYSARLGRPLAEEELQLRIVLAEDLVDTMLAAGPAPRWSAGGVVRTGKAVASIPEFIRAAHELPNWKYLAVNFGTEKVELHRTVNEGTS